MSAPEPDLAALPRLPRDGAGPVFAEPWQAQAFALAVELSAAGVFSWPQWAAALGAELASDPDDDGARYYDHWVAALERLVAGHGLLAPPEMAARKADWAAAYLRTPHGKPVELAAASDPDPSSQPRVPYPRKPMPIAKLPTLELYYERAGEGPPLLFISGTGGDLRVKPNMFDGPLAKSFDFLAYDQRGLGRSAKPDVDYTMADYADDAAALMDFVGWPSAKVVGVSFGGMVAQELALRHPAKVERLVLACTSPGGAGGASYPFHQIQHLKGEERARFLMPISDTRRDAAWAAANPETFAQFVAMGATDPYAGEPGREMGARRQLEARAGHDTWERLGQIACPVMIAAGRYDGIALPATQERMAARIPGAVLQFFDGGHLFMIQDRSATPAIAAFLNG